MIYRNSRYTKTPVQIQDGIATFKLRPKFEFNKRNAFVHQFSLGESLDGLALKYFNDPHLWWVILESNPSYKSELEIPYGTNLVIPSKFEVMKCLQY